MIIFLSLHVILHFIDCMIINKIQQLLFDNLINLD